MTAPKSVFTSPRCFCLVPKSLAPDSSHSILPVGKDNPQARFLSDGGTIYKDNTSEAKRLANFQRAYCEPYRQNFLYEFHSKSYVRTGLPKG